MRNLKSIWLKTFIALVLIMITVGGTTRLTRSGLSITEWRPITGIIPPLHQKDWQTEFEKYQASPEFQKVNPHFTLADYKEIFFWEYVHRLLGRIIFLWAFIPGLFLWRTRQIKGRVVAQLSLLVAIQGLVGWLMVKTGLNHEPRVSPFMLALHYFMAILTATVALFHLLKTQDMKAIKIALSRRQIWLLNALIGLLIFQLFYGCLTSGFRAGLYFNTYPKMGEYFLPPEAFSLDGLINNFLYNPVMIQFIHRWTGVLFLTLTAFFFKSTLKNATQVGRKFIISAATIVFLQVALGISLILYVVPIPLAVAHQLIGALIFLTFAKLRFSADFR